MLGYYIHIIAYIFRNVRLQKLLIMQVVFVGVRLSTPGFDSRHYQKKKVVGLERGPLSLVSTTEELLDSKVAASV
jgi:hypothetical protein